MIERSDNLQLLQSLPSRRGIQVGFPSLLFRTIADVSQHTSQQ